MFGLEMMIKQMLADAGIDIETVQREVMTAYQEARQYSAGIVKSQSDIVGLLKISFEQQKVNAQKLDAIMKHLNITPPALEESEDATTQLAFIDSTGNAGTESGGSGKLN